jgi:hypothetical protein
MPNYKISQLTTATAVSATNQFEINQNAASRSLEVSVLSTYIRSGDSGKAIVVSVSTASDAVRITQTGTGNALVVEDSANPDSTPFVVDASGNVGIGTSSPGARLDVVSDANALGLNIRGRAADSIGALRFANNANSSELARIQAESSSNLLFTIGSSATERMRIDSSGNVGIGTSSPGSAYRLAVSGNNTGMSIQDTGSVGTWLDFKTGSGTVQGNIYFNFTNGYMTFGTAAAGSSQVERARITAGGRIGIKTSVPTSLLTISTPGDTENITKLTINGYGDFRGYGCIMQPNNDTNCVPFLFTNAAGTVVGSISTNASGTSFTTSSDYRLKHDVQPLTTGLATIAALKPSTYKWNADDSHGEGFIAHELAEHIPHAVTGEKDAVNADGSIKPQAVDYSKIVVHLVAALQGLKAESDALKARIATLEARQ